MNKPIIAVFGATGAQGGSVVAHLVESGRFRVRALTRRPDDYAGPADEVAFADFEQESSLGEAMKGAEGVFLVTDFWQAGTRESSQARAAIVAAKTAGVRHLVWSSLPNVEEITDGAWEVPHFTGKARVDSFLRDAGIPVVTVVQPPFYFENLLTMMGPQPMQDEGRGWTLPLDPEASVIHMGSVADMGKLVAGVFANPEESNGETLSMAAGRYSFADVVREYSAASGEELGYQQVPQEVYATFYPQAGELGQMFGYFADHTYMGPDSEGRVERAKELATGPFTSLSEFLRANVPRKTAEGGEP